MANLKTITSSGEELSWLSTCMTLFSVRAHRMPYRVVLTVRVRAEVRCTQFSSLYATYLTCEANSKRWVKIVEFATKLSLVFCEPPQARLAKSTLNCLNGWESILKALNRWHRKIVIFSRLLMGIRPSFFFIPVLTVPVHELLFHVNRYLC